MANPLETVRTPHNEYGEQLREDIFFKSVTHEPRELGTAKNGERLLQTKEVSRYTILKQDGKRFIVSSIEERIQPESGKTWYSGDTYFGISEEAATEHGGTISKGVASDEYAAAVYRMIEKCPDATVDVISRFIRRVSRAQKNGLEDALEAAKDFGSRNGVSDNMTEVTVSRLSNSLADFTKPLEKNP